jgi:pyridoxamine 5'-phosphate oxidase-like protein
MSERLPPAARRALEDAVLCWIAVSTPKGPHCTPVVFVLDGGRLWLTTARGSVKARAWRERPNVAGLVVADGVAVSFRGEVRAFDALDPLSWPAATIGAPRIARAAARFSMKNAKFFAGYAVDARRVPFAWTPPGRVFAEVRLTEGLVIEGGRLTPWGAWLPGLVAARGSYQPLPRTRLIDLRVPPDVRERVGDEGTGALAAGPAGRLAVLPARWRRLAGEGCYEVAASASALGFAGVRDGTPAALTIDRASSWRAAGMAGMSLSGTAEVFVPERGAKGRLRMNEHLESITTDAPAEQLALVRIRPERAVWWRGWASGTVAR